MSEITTVPLGEEELLQIVHLLEVQVASMYVSIEWRDVLLLDLMRRLTNAESIIARHQW